MKGKFIEDPHFQYIFNQLNDGIFITNYLGVAIWANDMSTRQLGVPRSEIIGEHVEDLENKGLFTPSVTRIVLEKRDVVTKVQTSMNRQYLATGHLVSVVEDDTEYILVQVKDITETVRASFKLERAESLMQKYMEELHQLRQKQQEEKDERFVVGKSKRHGEMLDLIKRVAPVDTTLLLNGETGVGKGVVAKEIHQLSNRVDEPFIQINCGAIPEALLESELFGYKKGAFTGASNQGKTGLAGKADGGTLFLDEIAELPLSLQPKILQLVQEKSFIPVGGTETQKVDIRIIAATHQDLEAMVEEKQFREDLYYRLNVVSIHIPALKERTDDIPTLIDHFFEQLRKDYHRKTVMDKHVVEMMQQYSWPGNIRELENMVEFLVVTAKSDTIEIADLPDKIKNNGQQHYFSTASTSEFQTLPEYLAKIEKDIIAQAKVQYESTRKAAEGLGITQSSYVRRLKKYDL